MEPGAAHSEEYDPFRGPNSIPSIESTERLFKAMVPKLVLMCVVL